MRNQMHLFDLAAGRRAKEDGMLLAALSRRELFELACDVAYNLARKYGEVHMDMVQQWLIENVEGYQTTDLGNAAGSVFKGKQWVWTGKRVPSSRVSNHGSNRRVWRLRNRE